MAISITKPTVGGSEDTWGTTINTALDAIVDAANGTSGTLAPDLSTLTINGTDVTATAAELNILDGVTSTAAELNLLDGSVANTVVNNKAVVYGSSGEVQATTVEATTVDLGNWTVTESAGVLYFATGGTNKMKLDASGNLTVVGNVTAYGSV
jgi:hypothetical protein